MSEILAKYLMRTILASTALVLAVLLALAALFEVIAELDDVQNDYQTLQAVLFAARGLDRNAPAVVGAGGAHPVESGGANQLGPGAGARGLHHGVHRG